MDTFQWCWAVIIALAVMTAYIAILCIARKSRDTIKRVLLFVAVLGGLAVYYYGYTTATDSKNQFSEEIIKDYPETVNAVTLLRAAISTAKMLIQIPDWSGVELFNPNRSVWYIAAFLVMHLSSLLLFLLVVTSLFAKNLSRHLRLRLSSKKVFVFFNDGTPSLALAKQTKGINLFIGAKPTNEDYFYADSQINKILSISGLTYALRNKECHLLFLGNNEDKNTTEALKVMESLGKVEGVNAKFHVRIFSYALHRIFEEKAGTQFDYSIIDDSQMVARKMVYGKFNPVYDISHSNGEATTNFEVLLLGMGTYGSAALSALIEYGQFVGSTFSATVVDDRIDERLGRYFTNNPGIDENYNINAVDLKVGSREFFERLPDLCQSVKRVVITLGNDNLNIRTAVDVFIRLRNAGKYDVKIFAVVSGENNLVTANELCCYQNVYFVGQVEMIFSYSMIINEEMIVQAKQIHEYYNDNKRKKGKKIEEWREMKYIKRESNISAAAHNVTKLILAGLNVDDIKSMNSIEEFRERLRACYENLAKGEHLRWNASYFVRGWQKMPLPTKNGANQNHILCLHSCLVDWEDLEAVEKAFSKSYRDDDRQNVDAIFELIKKGVIS